MLRPTVLLLDALHGLARAPGRSVLAGLGIAIGTASLSLLLALSDAVQGTVAARLESLGARQLVVRSRGVPEAGRPRLVLRQGDADALRRAPGLDDAAAVATTSALVASATSARRLPVTGASAGLFALRRWRLVAGRPLLAEDEAAGAAVAVVGPELASSFFLGDPLGQTLRVDGLAFVVVGVTAGTGLSLDGSDSGSQVLVPWPALPRPPGVLRDEASWLVVEPQAGVDAAAATRTVHALLRASRGPGYDEGQLAVVDLAAVGEAAQGVGRALSAGFLVVALIALGVGGIGIMNVMLAGAAERVREVGIRLAVGAAPAEIFGQFLVESVALCALSAAAGEAVAAGLAAAVSAASPLALHLAARHVLAGVATASTLGLVFGLHPAARAARVPPNEALRLAG